MLIDEKIDELQNLIKRKVTYDELAAPLGLGSGQAVRNRKSRNKHLEIFEIEKIDRFFRDEIYKSKQNIILPDEDCLTIDHIGIHPSCGKGTDVFYDPEISPIQIGINLIKNFFKVSHPANLKTFTASGDSMNPIIEHGDLILVDTGDTDFTNGGVFLITIDNSWFIKRLRQKITGELDIISDNDKYPIETLSLDTFKQVSIKGRVIKNLSRGL